MKTENFLLLGLIGLLAFLLYRQRQSLVQNFGKVGSTVYIGAGEGKTSKDRTFERLAVTARDFYCSPKALAGSADSKLDETNCKRIESYLRYLGLI